MACSGFELYGTLYNKSDFVDDCLIKCQPIAPILTRVPSGIARVLDCFIPSPDSSMIISNNFLEVTHTSADSSWGCAICKSLHSSGLHRMDFKILHDDPTGNTNTWRMIVGVVGPQFNLSVDKWIGVNGGIGYVSATGRKNNGSSTDISYGEPYSSGIFHYCFDSLKHR